MVVKWREAMNLLVIGDVHGCLDALKELLNKNWDCDNEVLVQVGDLIDRGSSSPETVEFCMELKRKHGEKAIFIKGNHEFEMIEHLYNGPNHNWLRQCGNETLIQYEKGCFNIQQHVEWFKTLPLFYENNNVFVSHAGIAKSALDPYNEDSMNGIIWNREELLNIGKFQIVGHTPAEDGEPLFDEAANSWNIDTGAGYGGNLTALKINDNGAIIDIIKIKTN
jgi:serine/threonine protein phosphatase 1